MKKIEVLVAALPLEEEHIERLKRLLPDTEIILSQFLQGDEADVQRADVIFGNVKPEHIKGSTKLKWVHLCSSGADNYVSYMPDNAVLTNSTGVDGPAIGEFMLAMVMAVQKKIHLYAENQTNCMWRRMGDVKTFDDSTCLVLGLGDLGGNFAKKVKALGSYVIGVRRVNTEKPEYVDELHLASSFRELLPRADIVALALPNTPETTEIINADTISLMKPGAILLNVGRGKAVNQEALIEALESGHLAGAALDVMVPEPLPADNPLWKAKNLLITPHVSGRWTLPSIMERTLDLFERNLRAYENGQELENTVDYETGYRKS